MEKGQGREEGESTPLRRRGHNTSEGEEVASRSYGHCNIHNYVALVCNDNDNTISCLYTTVVIDAKSKWPEAIKMGNITAQTTVKKATNAIFYSWDS